MSVITIDPFERERATDAALWTLAALVVAALHVGLAVAYLLLKPAPEGRAEVPVIDVADGVRKLLGGHGEIVKLSIEESRAKAGLFADALLLDQMASGDKAREELGWSPSAPSLWQELSPGGAYATAD